MEKYPYVEDEVLTQYIWNHYSRFFNRLEQLGGKAVMVDEKVMATSSQNMKDKIREVWGKDSDPEVLAALEDGVEIFRIRARDRIIRDHSDQVFINRCPSCQKIVRTPRAKQCLWCGYSWHR